MPSSAHGTEGCGKAAPDTLGQENGSKPENGNQQRVENKKMIRRLKMANRPHRARHVASWLLLHAAGIHGSFLASRAARSVRPRHSASARHFHKVDKTLVDTDLPIRQAVFRMKKPVSYADFAAACQFTWLTKILQQFDFQRFTG